MKRKKKKHIVMAAALLTCTLAYAPVSASAASLPVQEPLVYDWSESSNLGLQRSYIAAADPCKFVQVAADQGYDILLPQDSAVTASKVTLQKILKKWGKLIIYSVVAALAGTVAYFLGKKKRRK